jgi:hypothetical protein
MGVRTPALPQPAASRLLRAVRGTVGAASVTLACAVAVVAFQPVGSPWWITASSDAPYTASSIDLMAGEKTLYLQQPGMPLQDLMAVTTETRYVAHKLTSEHETPHVYAGQRLLHLDDSRIFARGYAILFYLAGALLAFVALGRLLGSSWWGAAGALLFLGAPGLPTASIRFEPDTLLAGLVLAIGYLLVRAAEKRDAWLYTLSSLLLGLALTVKVHAAGLLVPFAFALLWRPPSTSRRALFNASVDWFRRYRVPLIGFLAIWVVFCTTFDRSRVPFTMTHRQSAVVTWIVVAAVVYAALVALTAQVSSLRRFARWPLRPVGLLLACALALGVVLPGTLVLNDLPQMLIEMGRALGHGGVDSAAPGASTSWSELVHVPVVLALVLLALAAVAASIGFMTREIQPLLWFSGAAATFLMATAHVGPSTNFAPSFVLSIPPVLWLARRLPASAAMIGATALVVAVLVPTFRDVSKASNAARLQERQAAEMIAAADHVLTKPNTVALTEDLTPLPDIRWHDDVQQVVAWSPDYPYRFLPNSPAGVNTAAHDHLAPAFYIGAVAAGIQHEQTVPLLFGAYVMRPVAGAAIAGIGVAKLVSGPGVDVPLEHSNAKYDPQTGFYKDPSGAFWDLWGNPIVKPPKRSSG